MSECYVLTRPCRGIGSSRNDKPRRSVRSNASATGPDTLRTNTGSRNNSILDVLPMDHILAYQVSPTNLRPVGSCGIMLIEHMIHSLIIEGRVRLIHPHCRRQRVILRAVTVALINRRIECDVIPIKIGMRLGSICIIVDSNDLLGAQRR